MSEQQIHDVVDSTQHFLASREQMAKDEQLTKKLEALRLQGQARETEAVGMALGLPYIDLTSFPINKEILALIPEAEAREAGAVAFFLQDGNMRVAAVDPLNEALVDLIDRLVNEDYSVKLYVTSQASFDRIMKVYRQILVVDTGANDDVLDLGEFDSEQAGEELKSLSSLGGRLVSVSPSELVATVLRAAAAAGASDLHLEATPTDAVLRFRLDGVLQDVAQLPMSVYDTLVTRFKLLARVKVNVRDEPQDGRFSLKAGSDAIDLRFSSLPTAFGESVVIRFLGLGPEFSLDQLGLRPEALEVLKDAVSASLGLVLTTGPTGSGKTTALYAALRHRMSPDIKIITLENPVEVKVPGLQQVNISEEDGLTFATALRSVLRQDPDVVLVGEIRDAETAETAAQAAQTGHLVLSTLHANDAAGAIPRLLGMGVRPQAIGPALTAIMAQRLIRKLCAECATTEPLSDEWKSLLTEELGELLPAELVSHVPKEGGCEACGGLGYKGRMGIYEIFRVGDAMKTLIESRATASEVREVAVKQGMITMRQDGLLKALEGVTSLAEVDRVTKE